MSWNSVTAAEVKLLGLSAFAHDSAAALIEDGRIVAAAQEERFTRRKHDGGFPQNAMAYCLAEAGCRDEDVDIVAFCDTSRVDVSAFAKDFDWAERLLLVEHHLSHAASAFFPSPFADAAVLVMDSTTAWGMGSGNRLHMDQHVAHSLGMLYSAVTHYTGFRVHSGEYKVMGLAPYGEPNHAQRMLDTVIEVAEDGCFHLDLSYFDDDGLPNTKFVALFGQPARRADTDPLTRFHMDMAASVQVVTEHVVLKLARSIRRETGARNLCLAGGVALNCVANGALLREGIFDNLWIQPAAGHAGGALGAALAGYHVHKGQPRKVAGNGKDAMRGAYLGPAYAQSDIEARLGAAGAKFTVLTDDQMIEATAAALAEEKAVGWLQGRMEFGPRSLGGRSILGDPRSPTMQKLLNLKVKYRESFRPFAPSVLRDDVAEWFELDGDSPYMLLVAPVAQQHRRAMTAEELALFGIDKLNVPRSSLPAVTHVDYSARVQTVHADTNPRYHALISAFKAKTGCPVVVNTSFNVRGEPIVNTPEDAFRCFMGSEIEVLVVGNCVLKKEAQDPALTLDYKNAFAPD